MSAVESGKPPIRQTKVGLASSDETQQSVLADCGKIILQAFGIGHDVGVPAAIKSVRSTSGIVGVMGILQQLLDLYPRYFTAGWYCQSFLAAVPKLPRW